MGRPTFRSYCAHVADFYDHRATQAKNDRATFNALWDRAWFYHDSAEHGTVRFPA